MPVKPDDKLKKNPTRFTARDWLLIVVGGVLFLIGLFIMGLWTANQREAPLAVLGFVLLFTGGWLLYSRLLATQNTGTKAKNKVEYTGKENCINIYGKKSGEKWRNTDIKFEYAENPEGQPHQLINNGQYYFINWLSKEGNKLEEYTLPDEQGVSPRILARYIELPAQRKYLKHRDSLMKLLGPAVLAILCGVSLIAIIALAG